MPPKTSLAKPDTHVELKKEWALTLPLEYDEDTVLDRNEVEIFVRQLRCKINRADTPDIKEDLNQIFSMFAIMAFNVLKTGNITGDSSSNRNATMVASDLRHALCIHFDNLLRTYHLNQEYNTVFLSHFNNGRLPDEWADYLTELREDPPDDLDAWIIKNYKDKSSFQRADKLKIWWGDKLFTHATYVQKEICMHLNPLWKPDDKPSGKSMADFFRAVKTLVVKRTYHAKAIDACRQSRNAKDGSWGDVEKVNYVRNAMQKKMDAFDADSMHPPCWLAWLMCSYPIEHFVKVIFICILP